MIAVGIRFAAQKLARLVVRVVCPEPPFELITSVVFIFMTGAPLGHRFRLGKHRQERVRGLLTAPPASRFYALWRIAEGYQCLLLPTKLRRSQATPASCAWRSAWYDERTRAPTAACLKPRLAASRSKAAKTCGSTYRSTARWCGEGCRYCPMVSMSTPCARKSRITRRISSSFSPSPTISPDLVGTEG